MVAVRKTQNPRPTGFRVQRAPLLPPGQGQVIGEGLEDIGRSISDAAARRDAQAARFKQLEAQRRGQQGYALAFATSNRQWREDFSQRSLNDAEGLYEDVQKELDDTEQHARETLDAGAFAVFERQWFSYRESQLNRAMGRQAGELDKARVGNAEASIALERENVPEISWSDELIDGAVGRVGEQLDTIRSEFTEKQFEAREMIEVSGVYHDAIVARAATHPSSARRLYARQQGKMTERDKKSALAALTAGDTTVNAQAIADAEVAAVVAGEKTRSEALASIRANNSDVLEDDALRRTKTRFKEIDNEKQRAEEANLDAKRETALSLLDDGSPESLVAVQNMITQETNPSTRKELKAMVDVYLVQGEGKVNYKAIEDLVDARDSDDENVREKGFLRRNIAAIRGIPQTTRDAFTAQQNQTTPESLRFTMKDAKARLNQRLKGLRVGFGRFPAKKALDERTRMNAWAIVETMIRESEASGQRVLSDDIEKFIAFAVSDTVLEEGTLVGRRGDEFGPRFEREPDAPFTGRRAEVVALPLIEQSRLRKIVEDEYRRQGVTLPDDRTLLDDMWAEREAQKRSAVVLDAPGAAAVEPARLTPEDISGLTAEDLGFDSTPIPSGEFDQ